MERTLGDFYVDSVLESQYANVLDCRYVTKTNFAFLVLHFTRLRDTSVTRHRTAAYWAGPAVLTVLPGERPPRGGSGPLGQVQAGRLLEADAVRLAPGLP